MRRVTLCILAGLAIGACSKSDSGDEMAVDTTTTAATEQPTMDSTATAAPGVTWNATIQGQGSQTALAGTGQVMEMGGQTQATVSLTGAKAGDVLPWHVHDGTCAAGGPPVGDASAYSPMTVGTDGTASTSADITVPLDTTKSYHFNIHASPTDMGTIVGCGDLTR